jgi:hypothetical protein
MATKKNAPKKRAPKTKSVPHLTIRVQKTQDGDFCRGLYFTFNVSSNVTMIVDGQQYTLMPSDTFTLNYKVQMEAPTK